MSDDDLASYKKRMPTPFEDESDCDDSTLTGGNTRPSSSGVDVHGIIPDKSATTKPGPKPREFVHLAPEIPRLGYADIDFNGPHDSDDSSDDEQLPILSRRYRRRKWAEFEADGEDNGGPAGAPTHRHKLRPTSMAKVLGLNMTELELLRFYFHESSPILCAASGAKDAIWMGNVPLLSNRSPALKRAAMTFATMHLGKNRQHATYLLYDGTEHPNPEGRPDMKEVAGYVPLEDKITERILIEFTEVLRVHRQELLEMDPSNCETVLVTSVFIYIVAMSLGPLIPLANFDGGSDLFTIVRNLQLITTIITGQEPQSHPPFQAPSEDSVRLPKEEALWEIVELVELNMDYSPIEKRRIKGILTKEINSLIQLLNMDIVNHSVAHFSAWCTYWQPEFSELKNTANPYALMVICYYAAYTHMWHVLFWWADRSTEDVYHIMDHIPVEFHDYLQWPLEIVQTYEYNYEDMLSGKLREMTLV